MPSDLKEIARALAAPFPEGEVKLKPQAVQGTRALAIRYVDARSVQDRLDDVLGLDGWKDAYEMLPSGSVRCRLSIRVGKTWLTKEDIGGLPGCTLANREKAAFSDALKRAAVKFGVGRYLYRLPQEWLPWDPKTKAFVGQEAKPAKSSGKSRGSQPMASVPATPSVNGQPQQAPTPRPEVAAALPAPVPGKATPQQITEIIRLRGLLQVPDEAWKAIVAKRGVTTARDLTEAQAGELCGALQSRIVADMMQAQLNATPVQEGGLAADGLAAPPSETDFRQGD